MWSSDNRRALILSLLILSGCGGPASEPPSETKAVGAAQSDSGARSQTVTPLPVVRATPLTSDRIRPVSRDTGSSLLAPPERAPSSPAHTDHEAQQQAWTRWYEAARESPDVSVRLQALETWAQRPGDSLDPVTYGLVDQDESVRERAQALYTQQLEREVAAIAPLDHATQEPPARDP